MNPSEESFQLPVEPPKSSSARPILFIVAVVAILGLMVWGFSDSSESKKKKADIAALEVTLKAQDAAMSAERDKLVTMSQKLADMKTAISFADPKHANPIIKDYNALAADQRAEHDKYAALAAQYQASVAQMQQLNP